MFFTDATQKRKIFERGTSVKLQSDNFQNGFSFYETNGFNEYTRFIDSDWEALLEYFRFAAAVH